ncbi:MULTISPECIES: TetR/AcrR family transcriptional regulator [unclassified Pseudodesulfovibrio]|uniref:TetR/AcrR family transcriptional regulator n=1 Tax=unclassified Pseudodesulfovibrio TaxID=2661612 RepID=UPI000FEB5DC3|nr:MULTISPECIES: TetR/AcrR family transcriptional regulator [unclassified Pseudodesulfovibrio]MCJ2165329.1 TetR/AcrR family transcriptional regulator [Pseudodesulfovibrio sp. S3-i]RWU02487.1 TetR/AcrR family transcriptional regulator [Pseudodesulfovibrio sp. S3]
MTKAKIGRPRSEKAQEAILNATHDLLHETKGTALTIEAIAKRAEVGKPTIYRWWPTLADIVLETLLRQAETDIPVPPFDSLRATLRRFLGQSIRSLVDGNGVHLRFLMAQAQKDEAFRQRFRDNFVAKRRAALNSIFLRAAEQGQLGPGDNPELLVDIVFGAMWYRLLTGHAVMDEAFAEELTELVVRSVQASPAPQRMGS